MILGTILGKYTIENSETINNQIENFLYDLKDLKPDSDVVSNIKGWQKNELQIMPQLQPFIVIVGKKFEEFIWKELDPIGSCDFVLGNMFCNINPPGAYHAPHIHEADFTGVYYVKAPENSGRLILQNPHMCSSTAKMASMFGNVRLKEKITPEAGVGYFFPTYLSHYVEENLSDSDRISISYNINIVRKP